MTEQKCTPPMAHPLELIPFFRRWPQSWPRDVLYTVVWSCLMGLVFTALELLFTRGHVRLAEALWPMLLMSNLIGAMIHGGSFVANRLLGGWPRRARGLPRVLFSMSLMALSVFFGVGVGNLIWSGADPFLLLTRHGMWLQLLVVAAIVGLLLFMVRSAAERRAALAVAEAQQKEFAAASARMLAEVRLRALQAQIEPHFLYNTLANVVSLIGPQPAKAQNMLERFIDYLRASLAASRSEEVTLASESTLIAAYLDVLAVRMGERLRYRIDLPDELRQFRIAPMLLQPVVENAIAHGLEPKVEGGEITLSARVEGEHVAIRISDTGVGLNENAPRKPGGGVGLSNLRERLRSLYGSAAKVELLENQPCGMTVRLMLPLNASPTSNPSVP
ncbi:MULTISPECIES: sensor histidine kinase [unclassified Duganella]|uniref:sensor histidine kinase n=1 Tax=unclassified Duganella TaxID=2636909 RepID=UPI000886DE60|nr:MULTISPECIES: sensor histidine kinase [unclassified Duganella]SDF78267.1 Histidine kinase-, DNA gyrase B-, and HSP90-like ATPase [Duganella sp. OV458]SDI50796.1 Histidine kinase-, DNA gyrase B-, and HSP90-like ATPase [Duganella sp. OV510]